MKRYFSLLTFLILTFSGFSQNSEQILKKADDLIQQKKYNSAFKLLHDFDPDHKNLSVLFKKEDIVLDYYVSSIMHQRFGLKDLDKDESVYDYRGTQGDYTMYELPINDLLEQASKKDTENPLIYNALAKYYFQVLLTYENEWLKTQKDLMVLTDVNANMAIQTGGADYYSYYVLGYLTALIEQYPESLPYFEKSIQLKKDFAPTVYNMAYSYLMSDEYKKAIPYAVQAMELYNNQSFKSQAARMAGIAYENTGDLKNAILYYEKSNEIFPNDIYSLKSLVSIYLKSDNKLYEKYTKAIIMLDPENPTVYNELGTLYVNMEKVPLLIEIYKNQLKEKRDNYIVEGNLYFYLGSAYLDIENKGKAKEYLSKARESFAKELQQDHEAFAIIDSYLQKCE